MDVGKKKLEVLSSELVCYSKTLGDVSDAIFPIKVHKHLKLAGTDSYHQSDGSSDSKAAWICHIEHCGYHLAQWSGMQVTKRTSPCVISG